MKILYLIPWPKPFEDTNIDLSEIVNTQFGYYTLRNEKIDIVWYTHSRTSHIYKICKFLKMPQLNQLFCQIKLIGGGKNYDVIYVGFDMHLLPLALFRLVGWVKTPIFVLSHFSYSTKYTDSRWKKIYKKIERFFVYKAIDKISFACESLLEIAKEDYHIPIRHCNVANWGANLSFYNRGLYKQQLPNGDYFVAAGGMNRDYSTLIEAFRYIDLKKPGVKIFSKYRDYTKGQLLPPNISFENLMDGCSYYEAYVKLRYHYYNSIAILLPIDHANDVPNGATVLVEALAMGKPIVITEADTNYIDVEKEGVGLTVKRHDVDGWINAIDFLVDNPQKVKSMGDNAYLLAKSKYNDQSFANNILMQMKYVNN